MLGAIAAALGEFVVVPGEVGAVAVAPAAAEFAASAAARLEVVVERGVIAILRGEVVDFACVRVWNGGVRIRRPMLRCRRCG